MNYLADLNPQQYDAATNTFNENAVILAGAGSGKTKAFVARIAYILDTLGAHPTEIMAVTFTNKAAGEIKHRVAPYTTETNAMWLGTFHSICVRILHRFGSEIGLTNFTIMDTTDTKAVIRECLRSNNLPVEKSAVKTYLSKISRLKSNLVNPKTALSRARNDSDLAFCKVYQDYQSICWGRKCIDFDDLIVYTVVLLRNSQKAKDYFHKHVKYIMVDESQDTNTAQFEFVRLVSGNSNLFMVGDDDQSIYGFRNAKPEYLIDFKNMYPNAKIIRLEQNYRSTQTIVNASNFVVKNNSVRLGKNMFSKNAYGDPILIHQSFDQDEEALWVANEIRLLCSQKIEPKEIAILYRTNPQSRALEDKLLSNGIKYKVIGSTSFYERREIKDIIAYIKSAINPKDEISFDRVLGLQPGVGKTTKEEIMMYARSNGLTPLDAIKIFPAKKRVQGVLAKLINVFTNFTVKTNFADIITDILASTGYLAELQAEDTDEARGRIENLHELINIAAEYQRQFPQAGLQDFMDRVSLTATTDANSEEGMVSLMTLHSSKGLEFPYVFMVGAEESILPHQNSLSGDGEVEEERRLMYVGMTRAKRQLYITHAKKRYSFNGPPAFNQISRFVKEIPDQYKMTM